MVLNESMCKGEQDVKEWDFRMLNEMLCVLIEAVPST